MGSGSPDTGRFALVAEDPDRVAAGWRGYAIGLGVVAAVTATAFVLFGPAHLADAVMLYLLGVVLASLRLAPGPALATALLSVAVFDFVFIPPFLGFVMTDARHAVTFVVMLVVAVVITRLSRRVREQAAAARQRERRTAALYAMSRDLGPVVERDALVAAAADHISRAFDAAVVVLAPGQAAEEAPAGARLAVVHATFEEARSPEVGAAAEAVWASGRESATTLREGTLLLLPLATSEGRLGVLGILPRDPDRLRDAEERRFLEAFVAHLGVAVERTRLAAEAERVRLASERERLRNALLSSVSHDLRTPLGAIEGAASTLLGFGGALDEATRRELLQTVHEEARRLGRRVANLLDMTRLESGSITLNLEWQPLEEVVGTTLAETEEVLAGRVVTTDLPQSLPPVPIDAELVGQVFVNLLENAAKYAPPGTPLHVAARAEDGAVVVSVTDEGPGVPPGQEQAVFTRFHRGAPERGPGGVGLGLAICRAIVEAHGGTIRCANRREGGAEFSFRLPTSGGPRLPAAEPTAAAPEGR